MANYKRKAKDVDAFQFAGQKRNQWPNWAKNNNNIVVTADEGGDFVTVHPPKVTTPAGTKVARSGDWIVMDENEVLTVMTNAEFLALYEPM